METQDNLTQKLATGAKHGLIGSVGGRFLGVLGNVVAARILGPSVFGLYAIGWTLLRFVSLIMPLGMERSVLRFAPRYWKQDEPALKGLLIQTLSIALASGLVFGIILFCLSSWLAVAVYQKPDLTTIFRLYAIVFPVITLLIMLATITKITQKIKYSVIIQDLGQPLLGLILMAFFYFLGFKLKGVIFADVISISISSLVGIWLLIRLFSPTVKANAVFRLPLKELFSYALPAAFGGAFSVYIFWIDRILVGYFRTTYENGIYLAVSQISTLFLVIIAGINGIVVPLFSDLFTKGDHKRLNEVYKVSTKWGFYISAPFIAVLLISPGETLAAVYGGQFGEGAKIMLILIAGQMVNLLTGSVNPLLGMTGNQKFLFKLSGVIFAADILLNVLLIPRFGLVGAAVSTSLSLSALYLIELFWVRKHLGLWPYDRRYLKGILAFAVAFAATWGIRLIFQLPPFYLVIVQLLCAVLTFVITLILLKLDDEDKTFLSGLFKKMAA